MNKLGLSNGIVREGSPDILTAEISRAAAGSHGGTASAAARADPISSALQRLHDSVIKEEVPDSFLDLVSKIGKKIESDRT